MPIEHFHIPALILGEGIELAVFKPLASQIDMPPTLLSLGGASAVHPMIGHDLMLPKFALTAGRAIMQYNSAQAYMHGNQVVILRHDIAPALFTYDGVTLTPADGDSASGLPKRALAHANWSSMAYEETLYRLPAGGAPVSCLSTSR